MLLTLFLNAAMAQGTITLQELPPITPATASFGAAVLDGHLYVYGGHIGKAHDHSRDNLSKTFRRLNLAKPDAWEELGDIEPLQGVPLVAAEGKLYRIGGLSAKNASGEKANLHSVNSVEAYDPASQKWTTCTALPEGRSSHDSAYHDGCLYVVGGWKLAGEEEAWATSALRIKLSDAKPEWEPISTPFQRRALALVTSGDRLYAIGGMTNENEPSAACDVFDLKANTWAKGPDVPGGGRNSFGIAAWGTTEGVYASTLDGKIHLLKEPGGKWDSVGTLPKGRFFHRLLPAGEREFLIVAGANMMQGHLESVARFRVP